MIFNKGTRVILTHDITSQRGGIVKKGTQIIIEGNTIEDNEIWYFIKPPQDGINTLNSYDLELDKQYYRDQKLKEILK